MVHTELARNDESSSRVTSLSAEGQAKYLGHLQILRFVAAAMVLFGHVLMHTVDLDLISKSSVSLIYNYPWGAGVDVFFVISGFIITYIGFDLRPGWRSLRSYIVKRIIRVAPIYWLFTGLMLVATYLFSAYVTNNKIDGAHTVASFLFIAWERPGDGMFRPVLGQGWTLNYEMFFYVVFGLCILFSKKYRLFVLSIAILLMAMAGMFIDVAGAGAFYTNPIIVEFLFGVYLCFLARKVQCGKLLSIGLVVTGFVLLGLSTEEQRVNMRLIVEGIPALLIVAGVVLSGEFGQNIAKKYTPLVALGDSSYALYLCHPFAIIGGSIIMKAAGVSNGWVIVTINILSSIAMGVLTHRLIEKPLHVWLIARTKSRPPLVSES